MNNEITYDLLVHPFFSLIDITNTLPKDFSRARVNTALRNAKFMKGFWLAHIKELAKQPQWGIILIRPNYERREPVFR